MHDSFKKITVKVYLENIAFFSDEDISQYVSVFVETSQYVKYVIILISWKKIITTSVNEPFFPTFLHPGINLVSLWTSIFSFLYRLLSHETPSDVITNHLKTGFQRF